MVSVAVAAAPTAVSSHPAGKMKPSDMERWKRAFARANSYKTRPSTVAATEFFDQASPSAENNNCNGASSERWRTLPDRLVQLSNRLCDGADHAPSLERDCLTFTAAVFAAAPPDFLESFRDMFAAALAVRQARWNHDSQDEDEDEEEDHGLETAVVEGDEEDGHHDDEHEEEGKLQAPPLHSLLIFIMSENGRQ